MITRKKPSKHLWPNFPKYNCQMLAVQLHKLLRYTFSQGVAEAVFFISLFFFYHSPTRPGNFQKPTSIFLKEVTLLTKMAELFSQRT